MFSGVWDGTSLSVLSITFDKGEIQEKRGETHQMLNFPETLMGMTVLAPTPLNMEDVYLPKPSSQSNSIIYFTILNGVLPPTLDFGRKQ